MNSETADVPQRITVMRQVRAAPHLDAKQPCSPRRAGGNLGSCQAKTASVLDLLNTKIFKCQRCSLVSREKASDRMWGKAGSYEESGPRGLALECCEFTDRGRP